MSHVTSAPSTYRFFFVFYFSVECYIAFPCKYKARVQGNFGRMGWWGREFLPFSDGMSGHSASNFVAYGSSFD